MEEEEGKGGAKLGIKRRKKMGEGEGKVRTCEAHRGHGGDSGGRLEGLICARPGSFP